MLTFARNKLITVHRKNRDVLTIHGILDDDIYSLELDLTIGLDNLEILGINGKWNRWTTPDCQRSTAFLQEAVGFRLEDEDFSQNVHKIVGRKACRHYANLLLECSHTAREAAIVAGWEDAKEKDGELSMSAFLKGERGDAQGPVKVSPEPVEEFPKGEIHHTKDIARPEVEGGMVIDLHVHTSPASPCSSAPVDLLIEEAKSIGLDGICLTDHNYVWDPADVADLRQKHGFLVLRGNEITSDQGDMLVFGLDEDIRGIIRLEELRRKVENSDGFMIVAHPFRGFLTFGVSQLGLTPEKAMKRPLLKYVDAVEVLNGKVTKRENSFAGEVALGLGLPVTGGSDAHEVEEVGAYATRFGDEITSEETLIEALRGGNYSPIAFRSKEAKRKD